MAEVRAPQSVIFKTSVSTHITAFNLLFSCLHINKKIKLIHNYYPIILISQLHFTCAFNTLEISLAYLLLAL